MSAQSRDNGQNACPGGGEDSETFGLELWKLSVLWKTYIQSMMIFQANRSVQPSLALLQLTNRLWYAMLLL